MHVLFPPSYIIMFLFMGTEIKGKANMSKAIAMLSRGNAAEWNPLVTCVILNHPCSGDGSRELQRHLALFCKYFLTSLWLWS